MFNTFTQNLIKAFQEPLPGEVAQLQMAPKHRVSTREYLKYNPNPKKGCVLILFYPKKGIPHIALIVRADYEGVHSGQVSFPGGKIEESDPSLADTALRETQEELGIDTTKVSIISQLTGLYIPASHFWVYPFVGILNDIPDFRIDSKEVKQLIEVPIHEIIRPTHVETIQIKIKDNISIQAPGYTIQGFTVWGATAMMLSELREVLVKVSN